MLTRSFSGLEFSLGGSDPAYRERISHRPRYHGIQYHHSGRLRLQVDDGPVHVVDGPCAFITHPGVRIDYGPADGGPRGHHFLCFFGPRVARMIDGGLLVPADARAPWTVARPRIFLQAMQDLIGAVNDRARAVSQDRMVLMLDSLLLQLHEDARGGGGDAPRADLLAVLGRDVAREPQRDWDFDAEARQLGVTPQHFRRLFKAQLGRSPQQYVIGKRLELAARLLVEVDAPVAEVGRQAGIGNGFHFSRLFKRRFAVPPLRFRSEFNRRRG